LFNIFEEEEEKGFIKHGILMEYKKEHFDFWKSFSQNYYFECLYHTSIIGF
jgi:hypothetical protein